MKFLLSVISLLSMFSVSFFGFQIPLVEGVEVHDIAVSNVAAWPTFVLPSMVVYINVTVENQGTSSENFSLTAYAENLTIQTVTVDLAPGASENLTFEWQTMSYPEYMVMVFPPPWPPDEPMLENVTIWAEADVVAGEVDTSDNVYFDGTVTIIWMPPDVDGNGIINIFDIMWLIRAYGSELGDPGYNTLLDFNQDGKIDIYDIVISASPGVYGATYF